MRAAYSVAQVRAAEAAAMSLLPEGALMQRAAFGLATRCMQVLRSTRGGIRGSRIAVLCGAGNNGGDALFAVSRLARMGATVDVIQLGSTLHAEGLAAARAHGARVTDGGSPDALGAAIAADLIVDAIVGLGSRPGLPEPAAAFARLTTGWSAPVIAVDLPSGIDPDTGAVGECAVQADITVTFGCLKPGLLTGPGRGLAGVVEVVDIGLDLTEVLSFDDDSDVVAKVPDWSDIGFWFDPPESDDYKYSRGVVQIIAGSEQFPGAALLATGGARSGPAGLVRVAGTVASTVVARYPDVVAAQGRTDAIVVGPGIGLTDAGLGQLEHALKQEVPVVIDADGLTLLAQHPELLAHRHSAHPVTVLTPHSGEAERLGVPPELLENDRYSAARWLAQEYQAVVVLKGPGTVVAWPGSHAVAVDTAGTSDLATAGSGDVLAGLIGSLVAIGVRTHDLAAELAFAAVFVHGIAGRLAASDDYPVRATDLIDALPAGIAMLRAG